MRSTLHTYVGVQYTNIYRHSVLQQSIKCIHRASWSFIPFISNSPIFPFSPPYSQRRQWHPTPVFLPGKSHGWKSLVGCSPWSLSYRRLESIFKTDEATDVMGLSYHITVTRDSQTSCSLKNFN